MCFIELDEFFYCFNLGMVVALMDIIDIVVTTESIPLMSAFLDLKHAEDMIHFLWHGVWNLFVKTSA